eukprot:6026930-Prymnesium_polylepis.3
MPQDSVGHGGRQHDAAENTAAVAAEPVIAEGDEMLRSAMAAMQYEALAAALDEHRGLASDSVLEEARMLRDRLHKRRKKESQKLRRAHAVEMQTSALANLSLEEASPPLPIPTAVPMPRLAWPLTLAELTEATGSFDEKRLIGSGGFGRVFTADALPSLPPEALPPRLRHLPVAVKRAKSGLHDLADLRREVSVLKLCSHPHVLPLLGYYLNHEAPCLVFPLMRGGSFADRLFPSQVDPEHLRRLGLSTTLTPLRWRQRLLI